MDTNKTVEEFLHTWIDFKVQCEKRAKDKAKLNTDCWKKLMAFHTEKFLALQDNPFAILFFIRYKNPAFYRHYKLNSYYHKYLDMRNDFFRKQQNERKSTNR